MPWAPSADRQQELDRIVERYPTKMAACLPALRLCQDELGHLPVDALRWVAQRLDLPLAHVEGVRSFYTLFYGRPVGKYVIQVCRTLSCAMAGAEDLLSFLEKKLDCKVGETTPDRLFTLSTAECLASCDTAPAVIVGEDYHEKVRREDLDALIDSIRAKANR